ncbi:class I SAM-dependent methyltransferase [Streptomyces sp. NPDC056638]|uniref:class I SAM-dependent methyltransferase n=1 Tax=Streptomyces sp. NPDC056638 TaxID=3345887 RepID=UPI0036CE5207
MTTISEPMPYVDLLALVGETNRCPGGKRAVSRLAHTMHLGPRHRVLEVGSNTGFTSIELAALTGCQANGIEINPAAVAEANRTTAQLPTHIGERVAFHTGDVRSLPWGADTFDAVVCGGALGFVDDRPAAFAEIRRVLRPLGMVSITHLYYRSTPPPALSGRLAGILGLTVPVYGWEQWLADLAPHGWEVYHLDRRPMAARPAHVVDAYADALTNTPRIEALPPEERVRVREQWQNVSHVFNDNHAHLGVLELVLRRPARDDVPEQPELFIEPGAYDPHFEHASVPLTESETN